jgi:uncharacterized protein YbbK (DUF523 family)
VYGLILVSSCLLGLDTKYSGSSNTNELIKEYCRHGKFIPVCPEQLGGLSTPRAASEIINGSGDEVLYGTCRVITSQGIDETREYIKGAEEVIKLLDLFSISAAILKQRSPSCASKQVYDGTFSGKVRNGQGVTAALLGKYNIPVYSEEEVTRELLEKLIL